jgi:transcriptional regulator with XRE-family HTH domain
MKLAELLRKWRKMSDLSVRDVANQIGLKVATYSRIERGYPMDAATLVKVMAWMFSESK